MVSMKEKNTLLFIKEFTTTTQPFGNQEGKEVLRKLSDRLDQLPSSKVVGLSLEGIEATDASFARESVVALAKQHREQRGFYLQDFASQDLVDNWNYAATAKAQPLAIWSESGCTIIGPQPSPANQRIIDLVNELGHVTASAVSERLGLTVQNCSTNLKNLFARGYVLRNEDVAESGGREFIYSAIKPF